jgi:hypothetical protein
MKNTKKLFFFLVLPDSNPPIKSRFNGRLIFWTHDLRILCKVPKTGVIGPHHFPPKLLMKSKVRMKTVHRKIEKKKTVCPTNLGPHIYYIKFTPALHLGFEIYNQILILIIF